MLYYTVYFQEVNRVNCISQSLGHRTPLLEEHPLPVWKALGILHRMEPEPGLSQAFILVSVHSLWSSLAYCHVSIVQSPRWPRSVCCTLSSCLLHWWTVLAFQGPAQISLLLWQLPSSHLNYPPPLPTKYAIMIHFNKGMTSLLAFHMLSPHHWR